MDDQSEEINSSVVVATLIGKLQELLARAVETAMHTPDYFFNVVSYEKVCFLLLLIYYFLAFIIIILILFHLFDVIHSLDVQFIYFH